MKTTLKVFGIINIVVGGIACIAGLNEPETTMFLGGLWWIANGIIEVLFTRKEK